MEETCELIESVAEDLKRRLRETPLDKQILLGSHKFVRRYQAHKSNALLASALHRFGWVFGGSVASMVSCGMESASLYKLQLRVDGEKEPREEKGL